MKEILIDELLYYELLRIRRILEKENGYTTFSDVIEFLIKEVLK